MVSILGYPDIVLQVGKYAVSYIYYDLHYSAGVHIPVILAMGTVVRMSSLQVHPSVVPQTSFQVHPSVVRYSSCLHHCTQ